MNKPYLVTGASGFVGGHVTDLLIEKILPVRVFVRNAEKAKHLHDKGAEIFIGDLRDKDAINKAVTGVAGIFHIGATFREPHLKDKDYFDINLEGTRSLLDCAVKNNIPRFIHCSTTGVLGDPEKLPADETSPYAPLDVYQISKTEAEKLVLQYFKEGKIQGNIIRPAMIYGPRDSRFLKIFRMVKKGTFFYVGKGDVSTHFIDVRDLAKAFLLAMEKSAVNGEVFIIAGEKPLPLLNVINMVADYLKVKRPWLHLPVIPMQLLGEVCERICIPLGISPPIFRRRVDFFTKDRCFNTSKAKNILGFTPTLPFESELTSILDYYVKSNLL